MYHKWRFSQDRDKMELNRVAHDIGTVEKKHRQRKNEIEDEEKGVVLEKKSHEENGTKNDPNYDAPLIIEQTFKKKRI